MSGVMAGLIGSLKAVVAAIINNKFFFYMASNAAGGSFGWINAGAGALSTIDPSGNIYLAGEPSGPPDGYGDGLPGLFVSKVLKDGTISWHGLIDSTIYSFGYSRIRGMYADSTGVYVTLLQEPSRYIEVVKLSPTGAVLWAVTLQGPARVPSGVTSADANRIAVSGWIKDFSSKSPSGGQVILYFLDKTTGAATGPTLGANTNFYDGPIANSPITLANGTIAYGYGNAGVTTVGPTGSAKSFNLVSGSYAGEIAGAIASDSSNNIYVTYGNGWGSQRYNSYDTYNPTRYLTRVTKVINTTTTPVVQWSYVYSLPGIVLYTGGSRTKGIIADPNGLYIYVIGVSAAGTGYLFKILMSDGSISWIRSVSGAGSTESVSAYSNAGVTEIVATFFGAVIKVRADGTGQGTFSAIAPYTGSTYNTISYLTVTPPILGSANIVADGYSVSNIYSPFAEVTSAAVVLSTAATTFVDYGTALETNAPKFRYIYS